MGRRRARETTGQFWLRIEPYLKILQLEDPKRLAGKLEVDVSTISRWRYETKSPNLEILSRLVSIGIPFSVVMKGVIGDVSRTGSQQLTYPLATDEWEHISCLRKLPIELRLIFIRLCHSIDEGIGSKKEKRRK